MKFLLPHSTSSLLVSLSGLKIPNHIQVCWTKRTMEAACTATRKMNTPLSKLNYLWASSASSATPLNGTQTETSRWLQTFTCSCMSWGRCLMTACSAYHKNGANFTFASSFLGPRLAWNKIFLKLSRSEENKFAKLSKARRDHWS